LSVLNGGNDDDSWPRRRAEDGGLETAMGELLVRPNDVTGAQAAGTKAITSAPSGADVAFPRAKPDALGP